MVLLLGIILILLLLDISLVWSQERWWLFLTVNYSIFCSPLNKYSYPCVYLTCLLLVAVVTGFDVLPIPTPDRIPFPQAESIVPSPLQCSAQSLSADKDMLSLPALLTPNASLAEFCVLPTDFTRKQKKRFDDCVVKLGSCEKKILKGILMVTIKLSVGIPR